MMTDLKLPDLKFIKQRIPIVAVARQLHINPELGGATWTTARCWRPENHKTGDRTPSLNFQTKRNKYMCFACDDRLHSNLDLVMAVEHCTLAKALEWFDQHYPGIPRIKATKSGRNTFDFRAGVDEFSKPDDLVKAGLVPHLTDSALRVFTVLAAFRNDCDVSDPSFKTIKLRTGIRSNNTVAAAVRHLEKLSILKAQRKWAKGRAGRAQNQYTFTFDDPALFEILVLRAVASDPESTSTPNYTPAPQGEARTYLGNTCAAATALKPPIISAALNALKPPMQSSSNTEVTQS
jgi:hypothetical protein